VSKAAQWLVCLHRGFILIHSAPDDSGLLVAWAPLSSPFYSFRRRGVRGLSEGRLTAMQRAGAACPNRGTRVAAGPRLARADTPCGNFCAQHAPSKFEKHHPAQTSLPAPDPGCAWPPSARLALCKMSCIRGAFRETRLRRCHSEPQWASGALRRRCQEVRGRIRSTNGAGRREKVTIGFLRLGDKRTIDEAAPPKSEDLTPSPDRPKDAPGLGPPIFFFSRQA
jgi:hypothetical protein